MGSLDPFSQAASSFTIDGHGVPKWYPPTVAKGLGSGVLPPKFYEGSSKDSIWNKSLMTKAMNKSESEYLGAIANQEHASQKILADREKVGPYPTMQLETNRSRRSQKSNLTDVVEGLQGFNDSLRDELAGLKTYLTETNNRLEKIQTERSRRSTARSRSSMSSSILSTQRSHITATNRSHLKSSRLTARSGIGSTAPDVEDHRTEEEIASDFKKRNATWIMPDTGRSRRIKGYRIGHEVEMDQHNDGNRFPTYGAGAVTESKTQRHKKMLKNIEISPVVPDDDGHKRLFLNNMWMEDPTNNSGNWHPMTRHQQATFVNRPYRQNQIPYHAV